MKRLLLLLLALMCAPALAQTYPSPNPGGCTHYYEAPQTGPTYCSDAGHAMNALGTAAADNAKMTAFCQRLTYPTFDSATSVSLEGGTNYRATVTCKTTANNPAQVYIRAFFNSNCTVRNQYLGTPALKAGPSDSHCIAGCEFKITSEHALKNVTVTAPGQPPASAGTMHQGYWEYSGNVCSDIPAKSKEEEKPKTECTPGVWNSKFCITPEGSECYTASTGRTMCWRPGERGEKPDGPTLSKNQNGQNPSIPDTPPPLNENWETGNQTNVTTTNPDGSTSTNVNVVYNTSGGSPAGTTNGGTPTDSNGAPRPGGPGETDGDGNSANGGGDCETPPITSGDAIMGMVAKQTWATRCAVDAGNAAKVTGDIGNCSSAFTVEGTNANAVKLRAMRAQLCPEVGEPGDPGAGETDEDRRGVQEVEVDGDDLDDSGWLGGGGSCPSIASGSGGQLTGGMSAFLSSPPPAWCQYIGWARAIFIALATIAAIYILKAD